LGHEDIAIIGLGCRFPGAESPAQFWEVLRTGSDVLVDVAGQQGIADNEVARTTRQGLITAPADFDADFFDVSPREAQSMDPRQRVMLELSWELLESSVCAPERLVGQNVGVFIGAMNDDYAYITVRNGLDRINHHSMVGLSRASIANRISFALGLHGPSVVIDSAQSSSLVAVHMACQSLQSSESMIAIAGGVHLNLAPDTEMFEQKLGALSRSGRPYVFDERADGYVRGEGAGVVLLKPIRAAIADGDRIHAVIRGSAINNAGRSAGEFTVPSAAAQVEVIRRAHQQAHIDSAGIDYVELHGTGTRVGDPIEAQALGTIFKSPAREHTLAVGSVKTNIGHLGAAAGIAGLLKTALSLEHGLIPPSLNYATAHPGIDLRAGGLEVVDTLRPWVVSGRPRRAGVSSFGISGTNAHVILEQAPEPVGVSVGGVGSVVQGGGVGGGLPVVPWVVSAKSAGALAAQAGRLVQHVDGDGGLGVVDVGWSLTERSVFEHRAVVVGADRGQLVAGLRDLARGDLGVDVVQGRARVGGKTVMVFPRSGFAVDRHGHTVVGYLAGVRRADASV